MKFPIIALLALSAISASAAPTLLPAPRHLEQGSKNIVLKEPCVVLGAKENPRAAVALKQVLNQAGIQQIQMQSETAPSSSKTIIALGVKASSRMFPGEIKTLNTLKPEGYLLKAQQQKQVKLAFAGGEERGTYYAIQTLRQILQNKSIMREIRVVDAPDYNRRGIVEGFYGPPWSHQDRLSLMRFMGENKMNVFIYAPKDDPYHRELWKEHYPNDQLARMKELAETAKANFVDFTFAISPGLSISYSSDDDFKTLCNKIDHVRTLGIDHIALFLDDIPREMKNPNDIKRFKNMGEAHAYLINRLYQYLMSKNSRSTLVFCPTYYYIVEPNDYIKSLGAATDPRVPIMWTGNGVTSKLLLEKDADTFGSGLKRKPYVWDNYPVNDYARTSLLMGPIRGRGPELCNHLSGLISNPMNEAEASKIALYTYADYLWNSKDYVPEKSWDIALKRLAGPAGYPYFKLFAEQTQQSFMGNPSSEVLKSRINAYLENPNEESKAALQALLNQFVSLRKDLPRTIANKKLLSEIEPYSEKLSRYGEAGLACLEFKSNTQGSISDVWGRWLEYQKLRENVEKIPQKITGGVMEQLLSSVSFSSAPILGLSGCTATASYTAYQNYTIDNMLDRNPKTYFWGMQGVRKGDTVTVDLGEVKPVDRINLLMSDSTRKDDWIHQAELQYSTDLKTWNTLAQINTPEVKWEETATPMRAVRIYVTDGQEKWPIIREFDVHTQNDMIAQSNMTPAEGSDVQRACDGNRWSAFESASPVKQDDWIQIDLGAQAPVIKKITVLMGVSNYFVNAAVERSVDGVNWDQIGTTSDRAFQVSIQPEKTRYIRIISNQDQDKSVGVHEISVEK